MTVSVVIPVYRGAAHVTRALDAVRAQTLDRDAIEVLVVDDGSPDEAAAVVRAWAARSPSPRVRLIQQRNQGMAAARNTGARAATGEFLAFLDQDDTWPPDALAWLCAALVADGEAVMMAGRAAWVNGDGTVLGFYGPDSGDVTPDALIQANPFASPGVALIRTDAFRRCGGFDEQIWGADDWDLWLRLRQQGRLVSHARVTLRQLQHPGQASRDMWRMARNVRTVLQKHLSAPGASTQSARARRHLRRLADAGYARTYGWLHRHRVREHVRAGRLLAAAAELPMLRWGWRDHAAVTWRACWRRCAHSVARFRPG
jgi:glycosyltransferase involved in cell wall biosynthesis